MDKITALLHISMKSAEIRERNIYLQTSRLSLSTATANCEILIISLSEPELVEVGQQKDNGAAIENQPINKIHSQHVSRQAFQNGLCKA